MRCDVVISRKLIILLVLCSYSGFGQSIFESGQWSKLGIAESAVYKIDRQFLEANNLFDFQNLDPNGIRIFGFAGGPLPQENDIEIPIDPPEIPLMKVGLEDGSFDANDYILFFAEGPDNIDLVEGHLEFQDNIYADTSFYFLTISTEVGPELDNYQAADGNFTLTSTYTDLIVYETNERNILKSNLSRGGSGREWYGEVFQLNISTERTFSFDIPDFTGKAELILATVGQSEGASSFNVLVNGSQIAEQILDPIRPVATNPYQDKGKHHSDTFDISIPAQNNLDVSLEFNRFDEGQSLARLDKILIAAERNLSDRSEQYIFRPSGNASSMNQTVSISQFADDSEIWNITDPANPQNIEVNLNNGSGTFNANLNENTTFILFSADQATLPSFLGSVQNQNLKALSPQDGVIITTPTFVSEAERLQQFHEEHDGLDIAILEVQQIYNEFSSGRQDISAIRNAIKYYYNSSPNFKYALLLGDCSYDYKYRISENTNFVPTYESRNSLHPIFSYSSDDFFGFMEDWEGEWEESTNGDHTLEVGIGRIPARTEEEARDVINKIIRYSTASQTLGSWKNQVTYVVDDGDQGIHMSDAEELSSQLRSNFGPAIFNKLYLDAFEQEEGASDDNSPTFETSLRSALEQGTFLVNYIGHGNEFQWMDENVLNDEDIDDLTNRFLLPIFVTATCQFGRYDDPDFFSGSERLLMNENGGAIALLTTTRPVFSSTNEPVNEAFHDAIFEIEDGQYPRLGDIIRKTKNGSLRGPVNRNFALLGDPFLKLNYPDYQVKITDVNGKNLETQVDTLSALEEVTISGEIQNLLNTKVSSFNGVVEITLLDNLAEARTLGQENNPFRYTTENNALFRGSATVTNGEFSQTFIMTRNTSYQFEEAKVVMYAMDEEGGIDASGANSNIVLGGTDETERVDTNSPEISLFINEESLPNGATVEPNSLLIARITDDFGINLSTNGINQNITLKLNEDDPFVVNDFYISNLDDATSGTLTYPLTDLTPGKYTATIKVWDLYNNSQTATVDFVVSDKVRIDLANVTSYPNPASVETSFAFEHNRPGEALEVTIQLYDARGNLFQQIDYEVESSLESVDNLVWQITPSVLPGNYFYRMLVKSTLDDATGSAFGRLIVN